MDNHAAPFPIGAASWNPAFRPHHNQTLTSKDANRSSNDELLMRMTDPMSTGYGADTAKDMSAESSDPWAGAEELEVFSAPTNVDQEDIAVPLQNLQLDNHDISSTEPQLEIPFRSQEPQYTPPHSEIESQPALSSFDSKDAPVQVQDAHEELIEGDVIFQQESPASNITGPTPLMSLAESASERSESARAAAASLQNVESSGNLPQASDEALAEDLEVLLKESEHYTGGQSIADDFERPTEGLIQPTVQIQEQGTPDEARYEYQGDLTQADIAVDEAPTTGLLDGAATELHPIPTKLSEDIDGWGQTQELLEVSGDSALDNPPEMQTSGWGDLDEGVDFDTVLGNPEPSESFPIISEEPRGVLDEAVNETGPTASEVKNDAIEDLWAAAFSDDEILEDSGAVDPSGFFDEDDDGGFLDDAQTTTAPWKPDTTAPQTASNNQQSRQNPYQPISSGPYQHLHQSVDPRPASTPSTFLPGVSGPFSNLNSSVTDQAPRPPLKPSSSFVDKSKSGYASPYDLPTDIVAPRRRAAAPVTTFTQAAPPPPPRTSSMPAAGPSVPAAGPPRPPSNLSAASSSQPYTQKPPSLPKGASTGGSEFFADLPVAPKSKVQRPTYAPTTSTQSLPAGSPPVSRQPSAMPFQAVPDTSAQAFGGLQQPERLPLYPEQQSPSTSAPSHPPAPPSTSRYSPAPTTQQVSGNRFSSAPAAPLSQSRYAAAPSAPTTAAQRAHAFIPKTSSPLAYHEDHDPNRPRVAPSQSGGIEQIQMMQQETERSMTPPMAPFRTASSLQNSPRSTSRYAPAGSTVPEANSPPARPATQSPVHAKRPQPAYQPSIDRRPSAGLGLVNQQPHGTFQPAQPQLSLPSRQKFSSDLNFDVPQDERSADHLERWKGHPIFRWSPSGTIVSSFPKQSPFYAAGHAIPVIRCTAGEITIHDNKTTFPLHDTNDTFPGPLQGKGKSKKKDVIYWMNSKILNLEKALSDSLLDPRLPDRVKKRSEEKLILWKVVKLLVEHDNSIDGKPEIFETMRRLLVPNDIDTQSPITLPGDGERQGSIPEHFDSTVVTEIRKLLLEGQRERAVWFATENKLWSHAMLIASTMGPEIWKQLIHEFVKSQVQSSSDSMRSLAAVYEVFGGNWEESTDELVPPFARAGISVASTSGPVATSGLSGVDGLEKWRETLALILSNRSTNDVQAIAALGRLLAGYGRVEAAHICYVFAHSVVRHSGPDDRDSSFVLLGADHKDTSTALGSDLDSILLTEVYEYIQSLSPIPGHAPVIPHLQAYKLVHAFELSEHGHRSQAQAYCESIFSILKSSTRASPYYHAPFASAVEDLNRCLSQAPQTAGSSGLLSKLSSDKVSGSMWKRFNNFVAGDEDDKASTTSGGDNVDGPFGRISGNSPTISRAASNTDLYGAMSGAPASINGSSAYPSPLSPNSPYVPGHQPAVGTSIDRAVSGRYAPQPAGSLANNRSVTGLKPFETQRSASSYTPTAVSAKPAAQNYTPYQPQSQALRQTSYGSYVPTAKPEPVRSASDYNIPYTSSAEVPASISVPAASLPLPAALGSPYKPQPSPLSVEHSPPPQTDRRVSATHSLPPISDRQEDLPYQDHAASVSYEPHTGQDGPPDTGHVPLQANLETREVDDEVGGSGYEPPSVNYEPPTASYAPHEASYEPPSATFEEPEVHEGNDGAVQDEAPSTYQPYEPSYQPYEPDYTNHDDVPQEQSVPKPKKKSFMDLSDDEDISTPNAAALRASQTAEADRAADEAFRKAAEADAEKDKAAKEAAAKKGWFGGWFGKKDPDAPQAVRAKLGEDSSFYFDKDLGKWVNKKGGQEETKAAPTPPPPKGGPSRATGPPMSGPPSRIPSASASPAIGPPSRPGTAGPPAPANGVATPPMPPAMARVGTPGGLEPPSRPSTGLSNASSIDDLIGAPTAKKGTVKGKKRGGRYVDVMAK
ncbi:hypothetical protein K461DRAFT_318705 [Myriangium duriaei CBS 260.36]|uniref:Protein transport protein sec16 n=1 Tax=Myriangium duriaei CBS 260.36 TaxID=1168546 RepID=A0A9P4MQZ5_9PEZI|nr:hypothetical protein K461DRAFT_318705 [Myriangium duriaei CBS 260.36]